MPNEAVTRIIEKLEDEVDKLKKERHQLQREIRLLKAKLVAKEVTP